MSFKPARRPNFFYTTAPLPCPYVPGRTERKVVTELAGVSAESLHDRLSRGGFRRSHNIASGRRNSSPTGPKSALSAATRIWR
jgi:arginine-tRNA-protein transferase